MENPIKMGWFGGTPFFGNTQYVFFWVTNLVTFSSIPKRHTFGHTHTGSTSSSSSSCSSWNEDGHGQPCGLSSGTQGVNHPFRPFFFSGFFLFGSPRKKSCPSFGWLFFGVSPNFFGGFCEFLFCCKTTPARNGNSTNFPPTFMGFQPWLKTFLKTTTIFGGWTHPPSPQVAPWLPWPASRSLTRVVIHVTWSELWKGRVTSPQTAGPTGASVFFFSGFGRFPLVPELGDNYPKSGSFF